VETVAKAVGKELAVGLEEGVAAVPGPPTALRQLAEKGLEVRGVAASHHTTCW
jgi:hypothetical protein